MIRNRKLLILICIICLFILILGISFYWHNNVQIYTTSPTEVTQEEAFSDIEYSFPKYLTTIDIDADMAKKHAIEEYGISTIIDTSKYVIKSYIIQEEEKIGYIFFSETSEYIGYDKSFSDEYIFNDIINGITTNRVNAKITEAWIVEFQDGTKGYMLSFINRIDHKMYYEINMECWSKKHYYTMGAVTQYKPDSMEDALIIILSSLKHKDLTAIQETQIAPYDLLNSKRINNIAKDYLDSMTKKFRETCSEASAFCNGLKYNISSTYEVSENVYGTEISVKRYDIKKSAKQLINKNHGKGVDLQKVINYAKKQEMYVQCKTTLEINLITGDIVPDITFLESIYAEGIIIN